MLKMEGCLPMFTLEIAAVLNCRRKPSRCSQVGHLFGRSALDMLAKQKLSNERQSLMSKTSQFHFAEFGKKCSRSEFALPKCRCFSDKTGLSLEHDELISQFYQAFMHENALNPAIFPALRQVNVICLRRGAFCAWSSDGQDSKKMALFSIAWHLLIVWTFFVAGSLRMKQLAWPLTCWTVTVKLQAMWRLGEQKVSWWQWRLTVTVRGRCGLTLLTLRW